MAPPKPTAVAHRPRERLALEGAQALSDSELLAVLLGTGRSGEPVEVVAARLLSRQGGLHGLARLGATALAEEPGLGSAKASRIAATLELSRRLGGRPLRADQAIRSSRDVQALLGARLADAEREHFVALALDVKNRPLAQLEIAVGGLSSCAVTPADAFRVLLRHAASGVIFVHNHPSGDPSPSDEDVAMTRRLLAAGQLLGVRVLDHVILGADGYFSFLDSGLLNGWAETSPA
jgi:DNA repair protein RadC